MFGIGGEVSTVTIFRIKNAEGRYLVEFGIEPVDHIRIAIWSWREERGCPIPNRDDAEEILSLIHHKDCEIVEGEMELYVVDFW